MCHYFNQPKRLEEDPAGSSYMSKYNIGKILNEGIGDRESDDPSANDEDVVDHDP